MKILLFLSKNSSNQSIVDTLIYMLKLCGFECTISTTIRSSSYDLIIALNKKSLIQIEGFAKKHNIPLIYFFTASTIEVDYPEDYNSASAFFLIKDIGLSTPKDLFPSFINDVKVNHPISPPDNITQQNNLQQKVLVALDSSFSNYHVFLKILPTINLLTKLEFTIINIPTSLSNLINLHVKIDSSINDNTFYQTDFIIGNACYIHKAIVYQKPCIIVGDRGYGGILDVENFDIQYQHNFQGRTGAELDEYIPLEFLRADLEFLLSSREKLIDDCRRLLEKYSSIEKENTKKLKSILNQIYQQYYQVNHNLQGLCLKRTNAFSFVPTNETYLMIKTGSNVLYSKINKEEMSIINSFTDSCTYEDAFKKFNNKSYRKEEFIDFVRELLDEKVLQIV